MKSAAHGFVNSRPQLSKLGCYQVLSMAKARIQIYIHFKSTLFVNFSKFDGPGGWMDMSSVEKSRTSSFLKSLIFSCIESFSHDFCGFPLSYDNKHFFKLQQLYLLPTVICKPTTIKGLNGPATCLPHRTLLGATAYALPKYSSHTVRYNFSVLEPNLSELGFVEKIRGKCSCSTAKF